MIVVFIILILVFTYWSAFFSASEIALFSLPSMKIKAYQHDSDPRKRLIAKLVLHPRDLLVTIFMLNTLVNILIQNFTSHLFSQFSSVILSVGVPLVLTLVFGEIIPKHIAMNTNVSLSYKVAPTINFLQNLLGPIRKQIIHITSPISKLMFFFLKKERSPSKEEIQHMLKVSEEREVIHPDEVELINGFLNLQGASIDEFMQPRADILYFDIQEQLSKLVHLFVDQEVTRVPVCNKSIDNVIGIMTANQFFLHREDIKESNDLLSFLHKTFFVPETTSARLLLKRLYERDEEIAMVVDEYGAISGLITWEDLIEVVVGQISDKRDQGILFTRAGPGVIIASGKLELSDFKDIFGVELKSENQMTIGGWLIEQIGDIPKTGTKYELNGFLFHVLSAYPNRVRRLYIRKIG